MSELIHTRANRAHIRNQLLVTVSALALASQVASTNEARAEDADHPSVWIELGGQMEALQGISTVFIAPFMSVTPDPESYSTDIFAYNQRPARFSFGFEGKLKIQPKGSDWAFSIGLRYGRAHTTRREHQQGELSSAYKYNQDLLMPIYAAPLADVATSYKESHSVLDFSAGRDFGIGVLGHNGSSMIDLGVRFADFSVKSNTEISARPHIGYAFRPRNSFPFATFYQYFQTGEAARSFRGVGPSLSWNASSALIGNAENGEVTLDWGINAAVLFGRQKADVRHETRAYHLTQHSRRRSGYPLAYPARSYQSNRGGSVTVPNLGGFAGLSMRKAAAKVSLGYRADFFFGAVDTGIDVRRTTDLGFHGPFATISIGFRNGP